MAAPATAAQAITANTLVAGVVLGATGAAAPGAHVQISAWPTGATLQALPKGAAVAQIDLGTATTDASGHFRIANSLSAVPTGYVEPNGVVNYDVSAVLSDGTRQTMGSSAAAQGTAASTIRAMTSPGLRPATVTFDMRHGQVRQQIGSSAATSVSAAPEPGVAPTSGLVSPMAGVPTPSCTAYVKSTYYANRNEVFLNLYNYGYATVNLEIGSSHTLGVGFSAGGAWSAYGTATLATSSSAAAEGTFAGNQQLSNEVNYWSYYRSCPIKGGGYRYEHVVRPSSVAYLLTKAVHIINRTWPSCHYYSAAYRGLHYTKISGSNLQFAGGVSLPFMNLSALVVYSKVMTVSWTIPSAGEDLCGSTTAGWATSPQGGGQAHPVTGCRALSVGLSTGAVKPDC